MPHLAQTGEDIGGEYILSRVTGKDFLMALIEQDLPPIETFPQARPEAMVELIGQIVNRCFSKKLLDRFKDDPAFEASHARVELGIADRIYEEASPTNIRTLEKIADSATIKAGALVGVNVTVGEGSFINKGAVLENGSTVGNAVIIGKGAILRTGSYVLDAANIGEGAEIGYDRTIQPWEVVEPQTIVN